MRSNPTSNGIHRQMSNRCQTHSELAGSERLFCDASLHHYSTFEASSKMHMNKFYQQSCLFERSMKSKPLKCLSNGLNVSILKSPKFVKHFSWTVWRKLINVRMVRPKTKFARQKIIKMIAGCFCASGKLTTLLIVKKCFFLRLKKDSGKQAGFAH